MLETLFHIPPALFHWPWALVWILPLVAMGLWDLRKNTPAQVFSTWGVPILAACAFAFFALPGVQERVIDPADPSQTLPGGLAVRGYGMMMLLGIVAGVGLAIYRGKDEGLSADQILSLALTLIVFGILGARLFFVIQYHDRFEDLPLGPRLFEMVNLAKGGLVVYGSFIGASLALIGWTTYHKLSLGKVSDIIAPSFLVGLALGRIGCFLNGCCFGGYCEVPQVAVQFPSGSPPYARQIDEGSILGLTSVKSPDDVQVQRNREMFQNQKLPVDFQPWRQVTEVDERSPAEVLGIKPGDHIFLRRSASPPAGISFDHWLKFGLQHPQNLPPPLTLYINDQPGQPVDWAMLPQQSQPIHPTQLYSSLAAVIMAFIIAFSYRFRRFDGQSFLLMTLLYSVVRFSLELVRVDEGGQFGTSYSISQFVAVALFLISLLLLIAGWIFQAPKLPAGKLSAD